jgi:glucan 1,4-alpha-glucosidase
VATLYTDGPGAHWERNPASYRIERIAVDARTTLRLALAAGGGAAVSLRPATAAELKDLRSAAP